MSERRERRTTPRWVWPLAAVALASLPAAWLLAHRLSEPTEPRWTEADLPALPPREGNGWTRLPVASSPGPSQDTLDELLDAHLTLDERVAAFARGGGTLAMDARAHAREVDAALEIYGSPRFADACVISVASSCPSLAVARTQRLASLRVFERVVDGDFVGALAVARTLVEAHVDFAGSSRTMISVVVAALTLERSLIVTEAAIELARAAGVDDADWEESRRGLLAALDAYERSPLEPRRAVIAEYVFEREALAETLGSGGSPSPWLVDLRATTAQLDATSADLYAYAEGRAPAPPPVEDPTEGLAWWAYNPGGKALLSALAPALAPAIEQLKERRDAIAARVIELRAAL